MAVPLSENHASTLTRAEIIERVQALIAQGKQLTEAAETVWEELQATKQVEEAALLVGHRLVADIWRGWNIAHRPAAVARTITRPTSPDLVAVQGDVIAPPPPPRRIDLALVRETLDSRYTVDGVLWRLGDMTQAICLKVADQYRAAAIADEHKARHLRAIAALLKDGETVEQKLSEREIMRLYRITEPPGNTLA